MACLVQKYGGTSVANLERIQRVADRVAESRRQGNRLVVVVSAMIDALERLAAHLREQFQNIGAQAQDQKPPHY